MGQFNPLQSGPATRHLSISARSASYLRDDEILTCLIGHIYDAALDPRSGPVSSRGLENS